MGKYLITYTFVISIILAVSASGGAVETSRLGELANNLAIGIVNSFETCTGQVLSTKDADGVYIDLGEKDGINKGDTFEVFATTTDIIRDTNGKTRGYNSEKLAVIKVEWAREDYSFTRIIVRFGNHPVEPSNLILYLAPARSIFVKPIKGLTGVDMTGLLAPILAGMPNIKLVDSEMAADFYIDCEVEQKSYGITARLFVFNSRTNAIIARIERSTSSSLADKMEAIEGDGYRGWILPEKVCDFISLDKEKLVFLGSNNLIIAGLKDNLSILKKYPLDGNAGVFTREPIGRLQLLDLDYDGVSELLVSRSGDKSGQFYIPENDSLSLAGYIPGIPLSVDSKGRLITSSLIPGSNLFDPQKTRLTTVSKDGNGGEVLLTDISSPFMDAGLVEINQDDKSELAVITPDGKLVIKEIGANGNGFSTSIQGAGIGIYQDSDGVIYTSSSDQFRDCVVSWRFETNRLVKLSQSSSLPLRIYRTGMINSQIAALCLDETGRSVLLILDKF